MTQAQANMDRWHAAERSIAVRLQVFADMMAGTVPLTRAEVDTLADARPEVWGMFRGMGVDPA